MGTLCQQRKILQKKAYFKEVQSDDPTFQNLKTKVKLEFTIRSIEKNQNYQIKAFFTNKPNDIFITEVVHSTHSLITFNTCYICDYFFERNQNMTISLIKGSLLEGTIKVTLGNIVGSPNSCYKNSISNGTNIVITAQGISNTNSFVEIEFSVNSALDFTNKKNLISYLITNNSKKIYSSESISWSCSFDKIRIPTALIQNGFTISFLDSLQETLQFKNETIQTFIQPTNNIYSRLRVNGKLVDIYNRSRLIKNINFIDYIKNGVTIKLTIGIDYTSSNKPPNDPCSLHFLGPSMNDYEQAIKACGMIVAYYDYNQLFPVYGFGAVLKSENKPNMCFNVNMKENPEIYTIDNVIEEYRKSFSNLYLAGPTEFCPLIKKVIERIKLENDPLKYHILLILTDGVIYDMKETIDALVDGSFLPLSVIIIGIGNDHFQEMIQLDGDEVPLINSNGIKRMRDLVQFVPYNKYKYDPNKLVEQVLEEVPRQIIEFYTMNKIEPDNLQQARVNASILNNVPIQSNIYNSNIPNTSNYYTQNGMGNNKLNFKNSSIYY